MSGNIGGRIGKLERESAESAGVVVEDRRFSVVHGERPGIAPALVVKIEDPWAWPAEEVA
jgi:hypothetical protein